MDASPDLDGYMEYRVECCRVYCLANGPTRKTEAEAIAAFTMPEAVAAAVQAEREACARIVEDDYLDDEANSYSPRKVRERCAKKIRSRGPAPSVDVIGHAKAARNEIWGADLVVTMERLLHAVEPCRGTDFGLETAESERLEAAIRDAKRALVPPQPNTVPGAAAKDKGEGR